LVERRERLEVRGQACGATELRRNLLHLEREVVVDSAVE